MINLNVLYKYNDSNQQRGLLIGFVNAEIDSPLLGIIVNEAGKILTVDIEYIKVVR